MDINDIRLIDALKWDNWDIHYSRPDDSVNNIDDHDHRNINEYILEITRIGDLNSDIDIGIHEYIEHLLVRYQQFLDCDNADVHLYFRKWEKIKGKNLINLQASENVVDKSANGVSDLNSIRYHFIFKISN